MIINFAELVGSNAPDFGWWIGVGFAFWYLPDLVTVGFSRSWGRWPQAAALLLALALVMVDLVAYGSVWAPPLGWGVFSFTAFYYGLIGVSFILADECEMCGSTVDIEVHHIRALRDLSVKGQGEKPTWVQIMAARKRKTLVVCRTCHTDIHHGRSNPQTQT